MGTELVAPATPAPLLPMEPEQASTMMEAYRALCESILTPDDVIGIPGTLGGFVKRSGWSKLATFYGVSTEIVFNDTARDEEGKPIRSRAVVRATSANGRHADGDGACAITEPRFKSPSGRTKAEHDVMATAVTRATNRAISNLIGFGSISAEEVEGETPAARAFGPPASVPEEDGMLRALEDTGALAKPATRIADKAGYVPKAAALMAMYIAAAIKEQGEKDLALDTTEPTVEAKEEPMPWDPPAEPQPSTGATNDE